MSTDYKARNRGEPTMPLSERLYAKVNINGRTGCWEWSGATRRGYGRLTVGSRTNGTRRSESAHRVSFNLAKGAIPNGMEVCHVCDNPKCINPDHLFLGTKADNAHDRDRKGRNIVHTGEEQSRAKLTRRTVQAARWERAMNGTSYQKLADKYGVSKRTIQNAVKGKTWKCVTYMPEAPEVNV